MEKLKKQRAVLRRLYTQTEKEFESTFGKDDNKDIQSIYSYLKEKAEALFKIDEDINDMLYSDEKTTEDQVFAESEISESYKRRWINIKVKYEHSMEQEDTDSVSSSNSGKTIKSKNYKMSLQRRFKLPKLELRKFDGELKNWLGFWGQFHKIDEDEKIDNTDKFQYLVQATEPGSKARQLVESFPPTGDNYIKAIQQLKDRFARDDLLIENYIRGLLQLVLSRNNNIKGASLRSLYDNLSTQLQALDSLKVTSDKYAAMLLPMVESAIPVDTLIAWERLRDRNDKNQLSSLLEFLKREVEREERIDASNEGFDKIIGRPSTSYREPTATCIVANENKKKETENVCLWCDKQSHGSLECFQIAKLSLQDRKELVKKKNACFICLKMGHNAKKCRNFPKCLICSRRHIVPMCPELESQVRSEGKQIENKKTEDVLLCQKNQTTLLQTVLIQVTCDKKKIVTRALLDSGAQRSYIKRELATKLNLHACGKEILSHCLFGGVETKRGNHNIYQFTIQSLDGKFEFTINVLEQEKICGPLPILANSDILLKLKNLNIYINDVDKEKDVEILIGADYIGKLLTGNIVQLQDNLVAIETKLGWTLQGPLTITNSHLVSDFTCLTNNLAISDLWDIELLGIRDSAEIQNRKRYEFEIMNFFKDTVSINEESRYEVFLPWKEGHPELLNNKEMAMKRLHSTTKRLKSTGNLKAYDNVFKEWLQEGIIEEVKESKTGHYLPHHAVIKESSATTRVRPVFDASARDYNGNSLNGCLEKGINLLEIIPKLLIQFRQCGIGITSDIRKAFLQISLTPKDRDFLKFIWWKNIEKNETIIYRHRRVVFGITSSPFLLAATLHHHLEKPPCNFEFIAEKLKQSFYVDNCVTSVETKEECDKFVKVSQQLMNSANFDLRGWITGPSTEECIISVLGMMWNTKSDRLYVNPKYSDLIVDKITKRILLSFAQRIFDPIGFTSPVSLIPKILLQKTWILKTGWDEILPQNIINEFKIWFKKIHFLNDCKLPRRLSVEPMENSTLTLHTFCDASKTSYAACVFLRTESENIVHVQLVLAKSRVAPVKVISIPRLELIAALISVRLYQHVKEALNRDCKSYFWTDSSVVLTWIKKEANWSVFVSNRIREIRQMTNRDDWHHIAGSLNPADLPSRGCNAEVLLNSYWWEGPQWLKLSADDWPRSEVNIDEDEVNLEKLRHTISVATTFVDNFSDRFTYFSKYTKVVRSLGWIMRFNYNCRHKNRNRGELTYLEYEDAEKILFKLIQKENFGDNNQDKYIKGLLTFTDHEGIIRVKTKLVMGKDTVSFKCPILLPGNNTIIQKLIYQKHCLLLHAGTATVLCNLRERYWIHGVRRVLKKIVAQCITCKRFSAKLVNTPHAPLPENRIKNAKAFEVTGIDLTGPLYLNTGEKCWIVLFTCAIYRAVHLEIVVSLSTEAFLMAMRRFIARRGRVSVIYTDNGTNFTGSSNLLKHVDWNKLQEFSTVTKFEWKFNVPSGPWWGGWWERLIRMLKDLLKRMLGQAVLSYIELETILCDAEATMNSRPLTYLTDDTENFRPLTPACFIQDISQNEVPDLDTIDTTILNVRLGYLQKLRADLRQRFRNEYLSILVHRCCNKRGFRDLEVGEVVLMETTEKRQLWPLAIVLETFSGIDGHHRVAKIKTSKGVILKRPFQRLFPLEISATKVEVLADDVTNKNTISKVNKCESELEREVNKCESELEREVITRSGRVVKRPQKMNM